MSITLSGRLVDDSGTGLNGGSVSATLVGSGTPTQTVTTITHPTNGEDGWFEMTGLPNGNYKVSVSYQGHVRSTYPLSKIQLGGMTIGDGKLSIDESGNLTTAGNVTITGILTFGTLGTPLTFGSDITVTGNLTVTGTLTTGGTDQANVTTTHLRHQWLFSSPFF